MLCIIIELNIQNTQIIEISSNMVLYDYIFLEQQLDDDIVFWISNTLLNLMIVVNIKVFYNKHIFLTILNEFTKRFF